MRDRPPQDIWFSPWAIYKHVYRLTKKFGAEAIEKSGKLKPVREARIAAITALAMYGLSEKPTFIQLCKSDPPDAYIMQKSLTVPGQMDVSTIEITSYREGSKEDFVTQIARTKVPRNYQKYSNKYVLVIDLLTRKSLNSDEVNHYLNKVGVRFPVWTFRAIQITPDTIGEMVILNPKVTPYTVNFGALASKMKETGVPDSVRIEWVSSSKHLKEDEHTGTYDNPPWDLDIESLQATTQKVEVG